VLLVFGGGGAAMASRMALCPHDAALRHSSPFAAAGGRASRRRSSSVRVLAVASSAK
jgi:hypothetical protein